VSNGTTFGTSCDEATVSGQANPAGPVIQSCDRSSSGTGVGSNLVITTLTLPGGTVYSTSSKVKYSATLAATGGKAPYKWSLASGSGPLPTGLKLSSKGVISGKATTAGTYSFTVTAVDTKTKKTKTKPSTQNTTSQVLSITVS
jgi:hypothetical protein